VVATNVVITIALILALIGALRIQGAIVARGRIRSDASRKFAHIVLGTALLASWLAYRPSPEARWLAAAVPAALLIHFVLLGTGVLVDHGVVEAASRSGRRREFLHGPAYYVLAFAILTAVFWRTSPIGVSALMVMVVGDGLGEIAGRAVRSPPLPWNQAKTIMGSAAVFVGGWLGAVLMVGLFTYQRPKIGIGGLVGLVLTVAGLLVYLGFQFDLAFVWPTLWYLAFAWVEQPFAAATCVVLAHFGGSVLWNFHPNWAVRADVDYMLLDDGRDDFGVLLSPPMDLLFFGGSVEVNFNAPKYQNLPFTFTVNVGAGMMQMDVDETYDLGHPAAGFDHSYPAFQGGAKIGYQIKDWINVFVNGTAYFILMDSNDTLVFVNPDAGVTNFNTGWVIPVTAGVRLTFLR